MTEVTKEWPRPHYASNGGDAFLFYVVFGAPPSNCTISQSKYNFSGIPSGLELISYNKLEHSDSIEGFRNGYLWDELQKNDPNLARSISNAENCTLIQGIISDPRDLNYFRNVVGLIQWFLDNGSIGVYDPQSFDWWSTEKWRKEAFDQVAGAPRHHVKILTSVESCQEWFHTRGLRKFGRPDISVHNVGAEHRAAVIELINRFIEYQAFGGVISEGQTIRMAGLPDGMTCHHGGELDDPDFNNLHVEIIWPD